MAVGPLISLIPALEISHTGARVIHSKTFRQQFSSSPRIVCCVIVLSNTWTSSVNGEPCLILQSSHEGVLLLQGGRGGGTPVIRDLEACSRQCFSTCTPWLEALIASVQHKHNLQELQRWLLQPRLAPDDMLLPKQKETPSKWCQSCSAGLLSPLFSLDDSC